MHVLITSDTVGGVWTYTQELVTGLIRRGHRVTLVSLGKLPTTEQLLWTRGLRNLDYRPTAYRLEWMQGAETDVELSKVYLESLIEEVRPDVLHFNQYCYGDVSCDLPRIVVAHSDVVSWWVSVHGHEPEPTGWITWYRKTVSQGLGEATLIVAPSRWMLSHILGLYAPGGPSTVIYNGRSPHLFEPNARKEDFVLSVGRLWDPAKQTKILLGHKQPLQVCIAGCETEPGKDPLTRNLDCIGEQSQEKLKQLYARAALYAATSSYEPFGLAPLEAALSRCALVANDIPVFREVWGDCALFFRPNDPAALSDALQCLHEDQELLTSYADAAYRRAKRLYSSQRMVEEYEAIYDAVALGEKVA
jgi:glycogen(starch) synthase